MILPREIIYKGETWSIKDKKIIVYRDICNLQIDDESNKSLVRRIKVNDNDLINMMSRLIYAFQVYQTKGHDEDKCLCTGCRYARNIKYYIGSEICDKLRKKW